MDLKNYQKQSRKLNVKLTNEEELAVEYLPNYFTGLAIKSLYERLKNNREGDSEDKYEDSSHYTYIWHLIQCLEDADITDGTKKLPFKTDADKEKVLEQLSIQDLQAINEQIQEHIAAPLEKAGTD